MRVHCGSEGLLRLLLRLLLAVHRPSLQLHGRVQFDQICSRRSLQRFLYRLDPSLTLFSLTDRLATHLIIVFPTTTADSFLMSCVHRVDGEERASHSGRSGCFGWRGSAPAAVEFAICLCTLPLPALRFLLVRGRARRPRYPSAQPSQRIAPVAGRSGESLQPTGLA